MIKHIVKIENKYGLYNTYNDRFVIVFDYCSMHGFNKIFIEPDKLYNYKCHLKDNIQSSLRDVEEIFRNNELLCPMMDENLMIVKLIVDNETKEISCDFENPVWITGDALNA